MDAAFTVQHQRDQTYWTCPECGEESPNTFSNCWNCDAENPAGAPQGVGTDQTSHLDRSMEGPDTAFGPMKF